MFKFLSSGSNSNLPPLYHDYYEERYLLNIITGFLLFPERRFRWLQFISYVLLFLLEAFVAAMAVYTILMTNFEKTIAVKLIHTLSILLGSILVQISGHRNRKGLIIGMNSLKTGIQHYSEIIQEQENIMKEKLSIIRFVVAAMVNIINSCIVVFTCLVPLFQLITKSDEEDGILNRYLPLSIYFPFTTTTVFGYSVAFLCILLFYFFVLTLFANNNEIASSSSLQICAHLDLLKYSVENIERRARMKCQKKYRLNLSDESPMDTPQLQECLYVCLKENVIHHLKILRLFNAVKGFLNDSFRMAMLFFSIIMAAAMTILIKDSSNVIVIIILVSDISGFFQMCFLGQMITDKSEALSEAVYGTPWYSCTKKYGMLTLAMIHNAQRPIRIQALTCFSSLETFSDGCSSGYKIVSLLR